MPISLERTNEILSSWEEISFRLFVKAINKKNVKDNAATVKMTDDIYLQLSVCLNDLDTEDNMIVQMTSPWKFFEYTSGGMSRSDILRLAMENTLSMFPPTCNELPKDPRLILDIESLRFNYFMDPRVVVECPETFLVVSNSSKINGSTVIFLPGVAKKLSEIYNSDIIIAFTSIHEAMVHSISGVLSPKQIGEVIRCPEFVDGPEFLSDKVYIYDRFKDEIEEFIDIGEENELYGKKIMWDMHSSPTPVYYRS